MPREYVGNVAESMSYNHDSLDNTVPPEAPHNPMTETVDMFNMIMTEEKQES